MLASKTVASPKDRRFNASKPMDSDLLNLLSAGFFSPVHVINSLVLLRLSALRVGVATLLLCWLTAKPCSGAVHCRDSDTDRQTDGHWLDHTRVNSRLVHAWHLIRRGGSVCACNGNVACSECADSRPSVQWQTFFPGLIFSSRSSSHGHSQHAGTRI